MKKKNTKALSLLALILAVVALVLSCLSMASVPEDQTHLIDDLYRENQELRGQVEALNARLDQLLTAVSLSAWTLDTAPWADSTGADVTLTATPSSYQPGVSATLLVLLEGEQAASVPCVWDGSAFTATAVLSAADGYSYFCILTAPAGTQQLPLAGPEAPAPEEAVYLLSSLSAYCNLVVNDWAEGEGALMLSDAYAQVQLPKISAAGTVEIASAELVLRLNGGEVSRDAISLTASEVAGSFELPIAGMTLAMPLLEAGDVLELSLEVVLTDGRHLNAFGISWTSDGTSLSSAVG